MKFDPKSDEDIDNAMLIPAGTTCAAEVKNSENYISKTSGKESIKLTLAVYYNDVTYTLWAYLTPAFAKLWKHAITAMISQEQYETGSIEASDFEYKRCSVVVDIDEYQGKKNNKIVDFIKSEGGKLPIDNSLPF